MRKLRSSLPAILCAIFIAPPAHADVQFNSVGFLTAEAVKNVKGMHQYGVLFRYRVNNQSKSFWMPSSLDLSAGQLERGSDAGSFISFGPSYRYDMKKSEAGRWFLDVGVHPTYAEKSTYGGRPLGGNFHFTTHIGLGAYLDREKRISALLRFQHMSNAGIDTPNPGLDMLGLTFSYHFGENRRLLSTKNTLE